MAKKYALNARRGSRRREREEGRVASANKGVSLGWQAKLVQTGKMKLTNFAGAAQT